MINYIKLIRIHHWIKNLLIFCPLFFGRQLFNTRLLGQTILGFLGFSFITSSVYIINDICDLDADRNHPTKCKRPLASGSIPIKNAKFVFAITWIFSFIILFFLFFTINNWLYLIGCIVSYVIINIFYSKAGKNIPLLDILLLTSGFLLRVIYGSILSGISISNWLYLVIISASSFLAMGKRRNELRDQTAQYKSRKVLENYTMNFLNQNMYMSMTLTIVFYSLWCTDINSRLSAYLIATVPTILFIAMKYNYNIENLKSDGDPVEVIFSDKLLWILIICYILYIFIILYLL